MNLSTIEWAIVIGFMVSVLAIAFAMRQLTRSVADFLAGGRCAGRYLLTLSEGIAALGLAGTVANFEKFYTAGFAASWWGMMLMPIGMVIALFGWVSYRYRQTRALTMAEFFERRYSARFRVFAGLLAFVSGVLNFGVFPGIVARFLIAFCGLPGSFDVVGLTVPTLPVVMLVMLSLTLTLILSGGMVTVMITDFVQAQFVNIAFVVVMASLLLTFAWDDVAATLSSAPAGKSLVDPFDQADIASFNVWFFAIFAFKLFYNRLGWQGVQGYNCAAKSPHEAKMAGVLAEWRGGVTYLIIMLLPICAYVLLHDPSRAADAAVVQGQLAQVGDAQLQKQMTVPLSLVHVLPTGVLGLLAAALIGASIGNDTTYLHAWGSIFVQDVVMPFRKRPLSPEQHIRLLRIAILGVAAFSFVWSLTFPIRDYLLMYFLLTGAIYLAGSGAVIIGGLYWSRGTTTGAWAALLTGAIVSVFGISLQAAWPSVPMLAQLSPVFPIGGAWIAFIASIGSILMYVGVSLATCRAPHDMDKLLYRGAHASPGDAARAEAASDGEPTWLRPWQRRIGITAEFTRGDRAIYYLKFGWTTFWVVAFVIGTVCALTIGVSDAAWLNWWRFTVVLGMVVGVITVVWFLIGGIRDLFDLLRYLRTTQRDFADNGTVAEAAEDATSPETEIAPISPPLTVTPAAAGAAAVATAPAG
ncbi:MAG TPA: hypothetical protein VGN72_03895 [Tepidisphaeraceae bacterium]|nr:hypothetical protein [Tepidisphaeraceae bacterium]